MSNQNISNYTLLAEASYADFSNSFKETASVDWVENPTKTFIVRKC